VQDIADGKTTVQRLVKRQLPACHFLIKPQLVQGSCYTLCNRSVGASRCSSKASPPRCLFSRVRFVLCCLFSLSILPCEFKGFRINHLCGNGVQSISELESGVVTAGFVSFCV